MSQDEQTESGGAHSEMQQRSLYPADDQDADGRAYFADVENRRDGSLESSTCPFDTIAYCQGS